MNDTDQNNINEPAPEEEINMQDEETIVDDTEDCIDDEEPAANASDGSINLHESEVDNLNVINIDLTREEDARFACPQCFTELDGKKYGKIVCFNCGKIVFRPGIITIWEYKTLDTTETREYNKIRAHIRNKLRDRNYLMAYRYCLKAELLAPGELATWEHFALSEFLFEITKEKGKRKPTGIIIKSIKAHLEKCNDYGIEADKYEILSGDIANKLFYIEKARVGSLRAQYKDDLNLDKWSLQNLGILRSLLASFELSYSLYKDTLFLEEYVRELTKPHKWILRTLDGELISTPACGKFNAVNKLNDLVNKIREQKPDYEPPPIEYERVGDISMIEIEDEPVVQDNVTGFGAIGQISVEN